MRDNASKLTKARADGVIEVLRCFHSVSIVKGNGNQYSKLLRNSTLAEVSEMSDKGDRTLTLLHLRKTFSECMRIPLSGCRDVDPNRLLPLFTKVMAMFTPAELKAESKEILNFTTFLCSVLVREVRQRAASHGTVEAASSIVDYLQPSSSQRGWLLLNSIFFLIY
ncbi:unnamed protein product [Cylicocyclus nassatus]|uniref:Uncharacterized protein n=1 Tax=Cylicocyclus nassatus TaxID=53992 RepID=A0AA36GWK4_CYLNA|nr:unnamed protein product [Cylicocyclus nassatus]